MEIGESIFIQVAASAADNKIQELAKKSQLLPITQFKNCKTKPLNCQCFQSIATLMIQGGIQKKFGKKFVLWTIQEGGGGVSKNQEDKLLLKKKCSFLNAHCQKVKEGDKLITVFVY